MQDSDTAARPVVLRILGDKSKLETKPAILASSTRSVSAAPGSRLLDGVEVVARYELARGARALTQETPKSVSTEPDEVVAIELEGGFTLFTSPDALKTTLSRLNTTSEEPAVDTVLARAGAARGASAGVARVLTRLQLSKDEIIAEAGQVALDWAKSKLKKELRDRIDRYTTFGASWLGTKALMYVIERQVGGDTRLCSWVDNPEDATVELGTASAAALKAAAKEGPLLVFIHGTASSTRGSFGELRNSAAAAEWNDIARTYGKRIFALEHRTFSESPTENALVLAKSLPKGAKLHLVTHSRGGLVGDLMCASALDPAAIERLRRAEEPGDDTEQLAFADEEDRAHLRELRDLLVDKKIVVERYVRVACPARGTLLAGENTDLFLSTLLWLVGMVTTLSANPLYIALKRIVLEIAKNRTRPRMIPGLEAMLPNSAISRVLAEQSMTLPNNVIAVIAGDAEGSGVFKRIAVFLTDHFIFDRRDHDLVVDTNSMFGGVARKQAAYYRFERSGDVSHFKYFANRSTRVALKDWLRTAQATTVKGFQLFADAEPLASPTERSATAAPLPYVLILPGILGTHLALDGRTVWFDPLGLVGGSLTQLAPATKRMELKGVFKSFYGDLENHLAATHDVKVFAYDWRVSVFEAAKLLAKKIDGILKEAEGKVPIRIIGHSMGGLVVRALIANHRSTWDAMMAHSGSRFVMLGTPNGGSHAMVETLLGISRLIRMLARIDVGNNLQTLLNTLAQLPGALELLPGQAGARNCFDPAVWKSWAAQNHDRWFGRIGAEPEAALLSDAAKLREVLRSPPPDRDRMAYVAGHADLTPSDVVVENGRLRMVGTSEGDGRVTWASGLIDGVATWYAAKVEHGDLSRNKPIFPALTELLERGTTSLLPKEPPLNRTIKTEIRYDANPVLVPTGDELEAAAIGGRYEAAQSMDVLDTLTVRCVVGDLRYVRAPVLVGHYEGDPISGAEAELDRYVVKRGLSLRRHLGQYPGLIGSATVVLTPDRGMGTRLGRRGAVVAGLGKLGELSVNTLSMAACAGALSYLLQLLEEQDGRGFVQKRGEISLAALRIGYNSTTNISIEDSLYAVLRGVVEANRKFAEAGHALRIERLEFLELQIDRAISATRALRRVVDRLSSDAVRLGVRIEPIPTLGRKEGARQSLAVSGGVAHWPRLIVTGYDPANPSGEGRPLRSSYVRQLKFVYLGQRARAETIVQSSQARLVSSLVRSVSHDPSYQPDLSNTLFHQLVPVDFKDAARQTDRMVLVVDDDSGELPWEMMATDQGPLAPRLAMVRQLASTRFRQRVVTTPEKVAYVVGDPSTAGYAAVFGGDRDPPQLPGAEREARIVDAALRAGGFHVEALLEHPSAMEVVNGLYRRAYRIVHIAAHGVFRQPLPDLGEISGVILSDGLHLTAAEIGQMEVVPELVFLNCCFLGRLAEDDNNRQARTYPPKDPDRLAYSLARELIEMGVRAVVVAGWAVDDQAAETFAKTFYKAMIDEGRSFGDALLRARHATYVAHSTTNTWGAYQAYGDPDFRLDPAQQSLRGRNNSDFVAPEELLDRLMFLKTLVAQTNDSLSAEQVDHHRAEALDMVRIAAESRWIGRGDVQFAIGELLAALGSSHYVKACDYFRGALAAAGPDNGFVAVAALEQLANLESRRGASEKDVALMKTAIDRLLSLVRAQRNSPKSGSSPTPTDRELISAEQAALLGGAYKRLGIFYLDSNPKQARDDLRRAAEWYGCPSLVAHGTGRLPPYNALNQLHLLGVLDGANNDHIERARLCIQDADELYAESGRFFDAVGRPDAELAIALLDGSMAAEGEPGEKAWARIRDTYLHLFETVPTQPRERDSVSSQLRTLSRISLDTPLVRERLTKIADALEVEAKTAVASTVPVGASATGGGAKAKRKTRRKPK